MPLVEAGTESQADLLPVFLELIRDAGGTAVEWDHARPRGKVGGKDPIPRAIIDGAVTPRMTESHAVTNNHQVTLGPIRLGGERFVTGDDVAAEHKP